MAKGRLSREETKKRSEELLHELRAEDERAANAYNDMHKAVIISHFITAQERGCSASGIYDALCSIGIDTDTLRRVKTIPLSDKFNISAVYIKRSEKSGYRFLAVWDADSKIFYW